MLPSVENLKEKAVKVSAPWEFSPLAENLPSVEIRNNKQARQDWYRNSATRWNFYTGLEGHSPASRPSKENPPRLIKAVVADYDLKIDDASINAAVGKMRLKPSWVERSLSGNHRLVWLLAEPLLVDSWEFASFILGKTKAWLQMGLLPGLDEQALADPSRLYCNGAEWRATGHPAIHETEAQAFFVRCGESFSFSSSRAEISVPLDVVFQAIQDKYPGFSWPGPFEIDTPGPSFWIEGSTSPKSAIVKKDGLFTFAAHASKTFYTWTELLGPNFLKEFETKCLGAATKDIYYDGRLYWAKGETERRFVGLTKEDLVLNLKVKHRVSTKPDKTGISLMDRCLVHIQQFGRVAGGAPILFCNPGVVDFFGTRLVNTCPDAKLVKPSGDPQQWGDQGGFPFISRVLTGLFDPVEQLDYWLAWLRYAYVNALARKPCPGQHIFLAGGPNVGKTLTNREIVGGLFGGYVDASRFLLNRDAFNSHLFESAVWSVDDETVSDSEASHRTFSSLVKACAANQAFQYHKKFETPLMIPWSGRIIVTLNLDYVSSRILPALDGTIMEKISFFKCAETQKWKFPAREEIRRALDTELPCFARFLVDYTPPAYTVGDTRYGVSAYHEPSLIKRAYQTSANAPIRETLIEFLRGWFKENPRAGRWSGSLNELRRMLQMNCVGFGRELLPYYLNRTLEAMEKEKFLNCTASECELGIRIWNFQRPPELTADETTPIEKSDYEKPKTV